MKQAAQFTLPTFDELMMLEPLPMAVGDTTIRSMKVLKGIHQTLQTRELEQSQEVQRRRMK